MPLHLGLDVGTQATKAALYDSGLKRVVGRGSAGYPVLRSDRPGCAEQHPATWKKAVKAAVQQALGAVPQQQRDEICSIGVSGQQHGLVVLDERGEVLRPAKLWCDTESWQEAADLSADLGSTMVPSFTASKVLWLKRHEPQVFASTRHVLLPSSYINFWLTGNMCMEAGDASGTGFLDIRRRCWDEEIMGLVDGRVQQLLPPLIGPDQVVGSLLPEVASDLGLPPGLQVSAGSGDNACSALGLGLVRDGQLVMSLGTSATLFGRSSVPVLDRSGTVAPFCDATGHWLPLVCLLNCTSVLQEVCELTGRGHEELTLLAQGVQTGSEGVNFLPYLAGERTPNWPHATGAVLGLRPGLMTPGHLYRAALEGVTLSLRSAYTQMLEVGCPPAQDIFLVGGGARNGLWRQMVADVFQVPVRVPQETETAALGAALQGAAVSCGAKVSEYIAQHLVTQGEPPEEVLVPDPAAAPRYDEALRRHQQYGHVLFKL